MRPALPTQALGSSGLVATEESKIGFLHVGVSCVQGSHLTSPRPIVSGLRLSFPRRQFSPKYVWRAKIVL